MKNLIDVNVSIGALIYDDNLMVVTLNGLGKDYNQFCTSIAVQKKFSISKT